MMQRLITVREYTSWLEEKFGAVIEESVTGYANGAAKTTIKITIGGKQVGIIKWRDVLIASEMGLLNHRLGINKDDCPFHTLTPAENPNLSAQDTLILSLD